MNPLEQQEAVESVTSLYTDLEERIMQNIIRHIKTWDQPIPSDEWQMERLAEIGKLDKEHIRIIAQTAGLSPTAIERMLEETAEKTMAALEPGLEALVRRGLVGGAVAIEKSRSIRQVMKYYRKQAKNTLNMCNTTMLYKARDAYAKLVMDTVSVAKEIEEKQQYLDILNRNVTGMIAGADSRQQALRQTIKEFNARGIPAFVDRRGRQWTPEAYVNMCMRATSGTVAAETQMARCNDYGIDLVEVDSHSGARPKCARDQGKIFDRSNTSDKYPHWDTSSYGEPDGLLGINCGHHIYPYVEGVNIRRYFPTEDLDANDRRYKEIQQQRALERSVRKQKRECMLFDELGDSEAFEEASVKLKRKERQLSQYVKQKELPRRRNREQVVGFDRRVSAEAVNANKKAQKRLEEKARDDKIKSEIRALGVKGQIELSPKTKIDVSKFTFDDKHINKERAHGVSRKEAEQFIKDADVSITRWGGRFVNYYAPNGAVFVDVENHNIRTAFRKEEFDERTIKMREVLKRNGKNNVSIDGKRN